MAEADLDDLLDNALEEFKDDLDGEGAGEDGGQSSAAVALAAERTSASSASADKLRAASGSNGVSSDEIGDAMAQLMKDMENPDFASTLEDAFKQLNVGGDASGLPNAFAEAAAGGDGDDMDTSVAQTLKMLAEVSRDAEGTDTAAAEAMGEDMMQKMMEEFEKLGEKRDFSDIIDGMMRQLLSKDVMYEPMKSICEKFPAWLAEHEDTLEKADYDRYGRMYQYFQKIVAVYESEPNNHQRLMELMQDMQECGQPPAEIVKELAPGLEFGPNGMPLMANMGAGVPMPPVPGMPPFPGMDGKEGCTLM